MDISASSTSVAAVNIPQSQSQHSGKFVLFFSLSWHFYYTLNWNGTHIFAFFLLCKFCPLPPRDQSFVCFIVVVFHFSFLNTASLPLSRWCAASPRRIGWGLKLSQNSHRMMVSQAEITHFVQNLSAVIRLLSHPTIISSHQHNRAQNCCHHPRRRRRLQAKLDLIYVFDSFVPNGGQCSPPDTHTPIVSRSVKFFSTLFFGMHEKKIINKYFFHTLFICFCHA